MGLHLKTAEIFEAARKVLQGTARAILGRSIAELSGLEEGEQLWQNR